MCIYIRTLMCLHCVVLSQGTDINYYILLIFPTMKIASFSIPNPIMIMAPVISGTQI
jgi:hypothetical protein